LFTVHVCGTPLKITMICPSANHPGPSGESALAQLSRCRNVKFNIVGDRTWTSWSSSSSIFPASRHRLVIIAGLDKFPHMLSLGITFLILASGIAYSLWKTRQPAAHQGKKEDHDTVQDCPT
jgi:hypothetical protein